MNFVCLIKLLKKEYLKFNRSRSQGKLVTTISCLYDERELKNLKSFFLQEEYMKEESLVSAHLKGVSTKLDPSYLLRSITLLLLISC